MFPLTPDQHHWLEVATEDEEENEAPFGPETRGEENDEEVSPSASDSGVWERGVSSPSRVWGWAPTESGSIVI